MTVLWDGTSKSPMGRYLACQPDPIRPAPPVRLPAPNSAQGRVLACVKEYPRTRETIAKRLGLTRHQVQDALRELRARGVVAMECQETRRHFGEKAAIVLYRAVGWGER